MCSGRSCNSVFRPAADEAQAASAHAAELEAEVARLQELTTQLEDDLAAAASGSGGPAGRSGSGASIAADSVLAAATGAPWRLFALGAPCHCLALYQCVIWIVLLPGLSAAALARQSILRNGRSLKHAPQAAARDECRWAGQRRRQRRRRRPVHDRCPVCAAGPAAGSRSPPGRRCAVQTVEMLNTSDDDGTHAVRAARPAAGSGSLPRGR